MQAEVNSQGRSNHLRKRFVDDLCELVGKAKVVQTVKQAANSDNMASVLQGLLNQLRAVRARGARVARSQAACSAKIAARGLEVTKASRAPPSIDDLRIVDGMLTFALEQKRAMLQRRYGELLPEWAEWV